MANGKPVTIHDAFIQVNSFLLFIPLRIGCVFIGLFCLVYCYWHMKLLGSRVYHDNKNKDTLESLWKYLLYVSDIVLTILGIVLVYAVVKNERNFVRLWLLGAIQNALLLLIYEFFACPLHYKNIMSKEAYKAWPYTYYYSMIPFVELYCMYVVNSYYVLCPVKPKMPQCAIPMTDV